MSLFVDLKLQMNFAVAIALPDNCLNKSKVQVGSTRVRVCEVSNGVGADQRPVSNFGFGSGLDKKLRRSGRTAERRAVLMHASSSTKQI